MRILNVTQTYAPFFEFGGPPVKVKALAEGMAKRGHQVTVLTADWGIEARQKNNPDGPVAEPSPFGRRTRTNGVTAVYLPNWFHYRATSWNPAMGRYLRSRLFDFDIVHIFGLYDLLGPQVAKECCKRRIPYIVEPIGMFVPIVRSFFLKRVYHRYWGSEMMTHASMIIATAEQEREQLLAGGIPQSKIALRRNGVEAPGCLPAGGEFRRSLQIREEQPLILFLGRLSTKKSPDLLLKAFAGLRHLTPLPHLAFVGPDESGMKVRLQQMASELAVADRVHFCAPLADNAKWSAYHDADIFVLPSQNENFGNTAAESVAVGTPVVVTDQCGIAPLLNGSSLVVKHDENELRWAMQRLLSDKQLYANLRHGCAEVMARLDWQQPLEQMEDIYSGLAARSAA
jgi:glycosyltransferase involved in cell wall biosynthesis